MTSSVAALAQESWREADLAVARAYAECARAHRAFSARARAPERAAPPPAGLEALTLAMEELASAMRLRGLVFFGKIGSVTIYDPAQHALDGGEAGAGAKVRFAAPGVTSLGRGVVLKACVRPVQSRKLRDGP